MVKRPQDGKGNFEPSRSPSPPSIAFNPMINHHDLAESSTQDSQVAIEGKPAISLPVEVVGPEDQAYCPLDHQNYDIVSREQQADPRENLANNTLRDGLLTPFASLAVDPLFDGERPLIERSSSLEVHASSPVPSEKDSGEEPARPLDTNCEKIQGFGTDGTAYSIRNERTMSLKNYPSGYSFPGFGSESGSSLIMTPPTSYAASCPSPMYPEAQRMNSAGGFTPSPHLTTIEEGFDCHFSLSGPAQAPLPAPYMSNPAYGGFGMPNNPAAYTLPTHANYASEEPRLPLGDGRKYPPCWTSGDGLLIVPSVPGELPEERPRVRMKNGHPNNSKWDDTFDDQSTVAPLSPNVTKYRGKGKHRRGGGKRYTNYKQYTA